MAGVEPDRMIQRYVADATAVAVDSLTDRKAAALVKVTAIAMDWDVIALDHAIWRFQSRRSDELGEDKE